MPAVAATNPPVLIGLVAGATSRIRVGLGRRDAAQPRAARDRRAVRAAGGGLPRPDRPRASAGRPGSDPVTSYALRHGAGGVSDEAVTHFPEYVDNVLAMMEPDGVGLSVQGRTYPLQGDAGRAVGADDLAARAPRTTRRGWRPRRACRTSSRTTSPAAAPPRRSSSTARRFRPSPELAEPRTFLTVNVVRRRDRRGGAPAGAAPAPGDADAAHRRRPQAAAPGRGGREGRAPAGAPGPGRRDGAALGDRLAASSARARIDELAATYDVDEVMVHPVARRLHRHRPRPEPRPRGDAAAARRVTPPAEFVFRRRFPRKLACRPNVGLLVVPRGCPEAG